MKLLDILKESIKEENSSKQNLQEKKLAKAIATTALIGALGTGGGYLAKKAIDKEQSTVNKKADLNSMYDKIAADILDNIEGGYYNPGQVKDSRYGRSGETMFGIDRLRGGDINNTKEGKKFWGIIDKAKKINPKEWKWLYKGGQYEDQLKELAKDMVFPKFTSLVDRYLSEESKQIVYSDYNLLFNFVYATWNGQGWFKKFAKIINKEVNRGNEDPEKLYKIIMNARRNSGSSLIKQSADKIEKLIKK